MNRPEIAGVCLIRAVGYRGRRGPRMRSADHVPHNVAGGLALIGLDG